MGLSLTVSRGVATQPLVTRADVTAYYKSIRFSGYSIRAPRSIMKHAGYSSARTHPLPRREWWNCLSLAFPSWLTPSLPPPWSVLHSCSQICNLICSLKPANPAFYQPRCGNRHCRCCLLENVFTPDSTKPRKRGLVLFI